MVKIGKNCSLEVVKFTDQGAYLDGGPYGEILLPNRYVSDKLNEGDDVEVFISLDSEDRIFASTQMPKVMVGQFAVLEVVDVNSVGAFLDWGLPKDLFVPFREQGKPMERGKRYLVYVYVDPKNGRIVGSSKVNKFLDQEPLKLEEGQEVDLLIAYATDLGFKAIINDVGTGVLYANEVFAPVKVGDKVKGFVKKVREDGKFDLSLEKQGYGKIQSVTDAIYDKLTENEGFLPLSDKSDPEDIKRILGVSKKTFKQAIGALYKENKIEIEQSGIRLVKK